MPGPSRYNRKLKAKNDRRKAAAARGGRTPSEAGLAKSMAASGRKVSKSNQRVGAPATTPKFGTPRKARRSSVDPALRPNSVTGLSERGQSSRVNRTTPGDVADALRYARDIVEGMGAESARIATDPNSTVADRAVAILPPVSTGAGVKVGSGLRSAKELAKLERTAERAAKIRKARKVAGAVKTPKTTAKKAANSAKSKASGAGNKAKRTADTLKQPGGKAKVAKGAAKATARGAGKAVKGAGNKAVNSRALPLAAAPVIGDEAGLSGEAFDKGSALVKGAVAAPVKDPVKYTATTGRGVLGMGVGFGLGAYALGNTVVRGARGGPLRPIPGVGADYTAGEIAAPTTDLVKQEWEGTKAIGEKLLSGDQQQVEQTFIDDLGGIMFIPGPAIARKIKGSDAYKGTRSKLRDGAASGARKQREETAANAAKAADQRPKADRKGRDKPQKKARPAIKDPMNPGEEYLISNAPIVRSIGGRAVANKLKRRNIRRGVSGTTDMEVQIAARETVLDDKDVQADIMGISVGPKTNRNGWLAEAERAAFVAANRGIPFNREGGIGWIDDIEASKTPETYEVGGVRESRVLDWIRENPEVLEDPSFQSAVQRVTGLLDSVTTSQRAKFLPVARVAGIKTPEERLAEGVEVGGRIIKETLTDPRKWEEKKADLKDYRAEARAAEARGDAEAAMEAKAKAKTLERRIKNFELGYRKAGKDFIAETEGFIAERGLRTPARMTDKEKPNEGVVEKFGNAAFGRRRQNSRATQLSEGKNLARDVADRSREGAWNDSILGPRLQRVFHGLTKGVIAEYGYKITTRGRNGKPRKVLEGTSREHQAALERGELPDDAMLIDAQYYRAAIGDKNAGIISFDDFLAAVSGTQGRVGSPRFGIGRNAPDAENPPVMSAAELRRMGREDRANEPGKKYIAVDREAMMELVGQIEGVQGGLARQTARLNRGASNVILGLNPSFIGAQQIAEGGPAVTAALTANPAALARMAKAAPNRSRGSNRQRAQREAMYGISGGTFQFRPQSRGSVIDRVDQLTEPRLTKPSKALGLLKDAFKGRAVNQAVLRTGASWRRLAGLGEIDRRTLRTAGSLGGLVTRFNSLERKFKGKSLAEVEDYMAANPKLRNEVRAYMDDVMGNFSTLTRLEARFAPAIAFYPYLRYSLKWGFFSFPRRHPMRASILYFLGQVNAEELEKLVENGTVADWIDNAYPVVSKYGEPYVLPGGGRFAPAGSNIFQSLPFIGEGNPDRAIGAINPGVAAIINAAYGRDSFSGEKVASDWLDRILLGASSFAAMIAPARAVDEIFDFGPAGDRPGILGKRSDTAGEFDALDPNRIERGIAPWGPLVGQSAGDYSTTNSKAQAIKGKKTSSSSSSSSSGGTLTNPFGSSGGTLTNPFK